MYKIVLSVLLTYYVVSTSARLSFTNSSSHLPGITPYFTNITTGYLIWNSFVFWCRTCVIADNKTYLYAYQPNSTAQQNLNNPFNTYKVFELNRTARVLQDYFPYMSRHRLIRPPTMNNTPGEYTITFNDIHANDSIFNSTPTVTLTQTGGVRYYYFLHCPTHEDLDYSQSCTIPTEYSFYVRDVVYHTEEMPEDTRLPCVEVEVENCTCPVEGDIYQCPPVEFVEPVLPILEKFCPDTEEPTKVHLYIYVALSCVIALLLVTRPVQLNGYQRLFSKPTYQRR